MLSAVVLFVVMYLCLIVIIKSISRSPSGVHGFTAIVVYVEEDRIIERSLYVLSHVYRYLDVSAHPSRCFGMWVEFLLPIYIIS